jgi:hypothetical protein
METPKVCAEILLHGAPLVPGKKRTIFYHQKKSLVADDGKNPVLLMGDFFEFPCADQSIDFLELHSGLERLERKYLYMILAEARRAVKIGGTFSLRAQELRHCWQPAAPLLNKFWQYQPLNPHHFLSPEDWQITKEEIVSTVLFHLHSLELTRIDGILPEISDPDLLIETDPVPHGKT